MSGLLSSKLVPRQLSRHRDLTMHTITLRYRVHEPDAYRYVFKRVLQHFMDAGLVGVINLGVERHCVERHFVGDLPLSVALHPLQQARAIHIIGRSRPSRA